MDKVEDNEEFIEVPVLILHDQTKPVGTLKLLKSALPEAPTWCLSLGFRTLAVDLSKEHLPITEYALKEVSITDDENYRKFLESERYQMEYGHITKEEYEHLEATAGFGRLFAHGDREGESWVTEDKGGF